MHRRLRNLEALADVHVAEDLAPELGRAIREDCEREGIACWSAEEDATFREWSCSHAGPELRTMLHHVWELLIERGRRMQARGFDVPEADLVNPWTCDTEGSP
jgi:hypothetical protein